MSNCLVTKLNVVVNNNNLKKLHTFELIFSKRSGRDFGLYSTIISFTEECEIELIGDDLYFTDIEGVENYGTKRICGNTENVIYISQGDGKLIVNEDKINKLLYDGQNIYGNASNIELNKCNTIINNNSALYKNCVNLKYLAFDRLKINVDLMDFKKCVNLEKLYCLDVDCADDIFELLDYWVENGQIVNLQFLSNGNILLNGEISESGFTYMYTITSNAEKVITITNTEDVRIYDKIDGVWIKRES